MKKFLHNFAAISITAKRDLLSLVFIVVFISTGLSVVTQYYSKLTGSVTDSSININWKPKIIAFVGLIFARLLKN